MWPESEMVVLSASFASPGLVRWVRLSRGGFPLLGNTRFVKAS